MWAQRGDAKCKLRRRKKGLLPVRMPPARPRSAGPRPRACAQRLSSRMRAVDHATGPRDRDGLRKGLRRRVPVVEEPARLEGRQRLLRLQRPRRAHRLRTSRIVRCRLVILVLVWLLVRLLDMLMLLLRVLASGRTLLDDAVPVARRAARGGRLRAGRDGRVLRRRRRVRRRDLERGAPVVLRYALDGVRAPDLGLLLALRLAPLVRDNRDAEAPQLLELVVPLLHERVRRVVLAVRLRNETRKNNKSVLRRLMSYAAPEISPRWYRPLHNL